MWRYGVKVALTAAIVVAVSELAKRSSLWAALLASLPLTSLLALVWLYLDTGSTDAVAGLSRSIFWLVLPSLPLFVVLPAMLRSGWPFWLSLAVGCGTTVAAYWVMVAALTRLQVKL